MHDISKSFANVIANDKVNFKANYGEIHAILGENGAGKSTLMSILAGIYQPDSGTIYLNNQPVSIRSPRYAKKLKIGMVHQHFKLVEKETVLNNILAQSNKSFLNYNKKEILAIKDLAQSFKFSFELSQYVYELSSAQKQELEILKILYCDAKILIFDEPTALLSLQEVKNFYKLLRDLKKQNYAIILITHKLYEIIEFSDQVTVLQKGKRMDSYKTSDCNEQTLAHLMVGDVNDLDIKHLKLKKGRSVLTLDKVDTSEKNINLNKVSFEVFEHEIIGIAGNANNGQSELCNVICGLDHVSTGKIFYFDQDISKFSVLDQLKNNVKISYIPEDRLHMGLVGTMNIVDNLLLKNHQLQKGLMLNRENALLDAKKIIDVFEIENTNLKSPVSKLSGGNMQKIILARQLQLDPKLIVAMYPTRGLDVKTCHQIYDILNEQKKNGCAIIYVGEDLDVLISLCDRIAIIHQGTIIDIVDPRTTSKTTISKLMAKNKEIVS